MFNKIFNLVIAVKNVAEATKTWENDFGVKASESVVTVPTLGAKRSLFHIGESMIELIEPLDPENGPLAKFLKTRGEGMYMLELEVKNLDEAVQSLQKKNVKLIGADPESRAKGTRVYIHPQKANGVLLQIVQKH
jgi:methylmalonyl-CoA epimerase